MAIDLNNEGGSGEPTLKSVSFISNVNGAPQGKLVLMTFQKFSDAASTVIGNGDAEALDLAGGNDTVYAGGGNDWVDGGQGNDTLYGQGGDDDLRGGAGVDLLDGGIGNDVLNGGAEIDTLKGGAGDDLYIVQGVMDTIIETAGAGIDTIYTTVRNVTAPAHVERIVADAALFTGHAVFTGNELANELIGAGGNDRLDGGIGADIMRGGQGNDTYVVDNAQDVVHEGLSDGIDTVLTTLTNYTMPSGVDKLTALPNGSGGVSAFSVRFVGNGLDNTISGGSSIDELHGGGGNDILDGGAGNDLLVGGTGNDIYMVDSMSDRIQEEPGEGHDTVRSNASGTTLSQGALEDLAFFVTLDASGAVMSDVRFTGSGNSLDNRITGWSLEDSLSGYAGNDTLEGLGGNDTLDGGLGDDLLDGGAGADSMTGGEGHDVYIVDNAGDRITEFANRGIDMVKTALPTLDLNTIVDAGAAGEVEYLYYTGDASFHGYGNGLDNAIWGGGKNDRLYGGDGNDKLYGNAGADLMEGGSGADWMAGGSGDDNYGVDDAGDQVVENAGWGMDTVFTGLAEYTLPANVENASLHGGEGTQHTLKGNTENNSVVGSDGSDTVFAMEGDDEVFGGGGKDFLYGHMGNDLLNGGADDDVLLGEFGNDELQGGSGNDYLQGGMGNDMLTGGAGNDAFVFAWVSSLKGDVDRILDFQKGVDKIDLSFIDGKPAQAGEQAMALVFQGAFTGGGQASVGYDFVGSDTVVRIDATGDGTMDLSIVLVGQQDYMSLGDFVL